MRNANIPCEIYPEQDKLKKQFGYADSRAIPYVIVAGETEINNGTVVLKDMQQGIQTEIKECELVSVLLEK